MTRMHVALPPADEERETESLIDEAVVRVLSSPQFVRAETQRKLLLYLWQNRYATVSEYAIATEALGRSSNFDPNSDASIRVHISRLRKKLKDYYAERGEPEVLVIPIGTHQLVIRDPVPVADTASELPSEEAIQQDKRQWVRSHAKGLLSGLCLLLSIALIATAVLAIRQSQQLKAASLHPPERANSFWNSFLEGDAPVKIVLPTPVFFNFKEHPWLKMRSTQVNTYEELASDPEFKTMMDKLGPMELEQSYTVSWDTLAAIQIARYLDRIGQAGRVSFEVTRDSSLLLSLEQANVIVLGTDNTLRPMREYADSMNFVMTPGEEKVLNTRPEKDEQPEYRRVLQAKDRHVEPSIIALLPGRAAGLKVLMLESRDTNGMVSLLASNAGSHSVEEMWRSHGSPKFFEMVVMTEMEGHTPLRSWPVTLHAYTKSPPLHGL